MKSCGTFACATLLILLLGSFPVVGADVGQSGNQACRITDWIISLQGPLERFTRFYDSMGDYLAVLDLVTSKINSSERGAVEDWLGELLLADRNLFLVLHEASVEFIDASADVIEDCGLSDEVSDFLSTPVDVGNGLAESLRFNNEVTSLLHSYEPTAPCFAFPVMNANHRFVYRFLSLEPLLSVMANSQGSESSTILTNAFVILYGTALEFLETARRIIDACGLEVPGTSRTEAVSTVRTQENAAEVRPTATPLPQDPEACQWQDAYRGVLDAFLIQVNLVNADSPDAPGKLRDYALNLANSLDDIRENCGLP